MIKNVATKLTLSRIILTFPITLTLHFKMDCLLIISYFLFLIAILTDALDGFIARKYNLESEIGGFLDALADKIFIYFLIFSFYKLEVYNAILVFAMFFRDMMVDSIRSFYSGHGKTIPSNNSGKIKFLLQIISINFAFFHQLFQEAIFESIANLVLFFGFLAGILGSRKIFSFLKPYI